ncbi:restriction endonuclease subunit S [Clostridium tetani]|uniref:restriction endonuclease subunit S n=1 Tax=Clostridium tetani TaxID=1513 RepID=UPI00100C0D03|nr:restriction endonuclease subunit S [Clostridium tetani]RXI44201.1 restriction endonuclease subunit S [Clostridium tetani]RXM59679.1 restriction endonuclease subunit S [Clostridium tetani]RXM65132.1 restriction endonuclease subunit S [Clostridium tetani]
MKLNKQRIGDFIEVYNERCEISNLTVNDVSGINRDKEFFEPSKQVGANTSKYKVVPPEYFACNLMHVGRDIVLPISMNHSENNKIVSPAYTVFKVTDESIILKEYFFMFLKSDEKDRFFWFNTDSSIREGLEWEVFCDIEIELPPIEIQKKYVAVYKSMLENQEVYENGLEDLQLVCDATIEKLRREMPSKKIKNYIQPLDDRNNKELYNINNVKGLSIQKEFIETKANLSGVSLTSYKVVKPESFAYVTVTSRNSDKITMAYNRTDDTYIVSSSYIVFNISKPELLNPEYLFMFFERSEFDRYTRFHSWGSARETFTWDDLIEVEIPIPDIKIQKSIVDIYNAYITRMEINEKLKEQIKDICPVLIKGSLEEVAKSEAI